MAIAPFTVSQVNEIIARTFKTEPLLRPVVVKGEVSRLNYDKNGNLYMSIKDEKSKLDCTVFQNRINDTIRNLSPGDEIICAGNIECFIKMGSYSLWVNQVEIVGEGNLAIEFEKLKQKLFKEGLFDSEHKKELPRFPKHIGVVTSGTGAAVKDILKILSGRTALTDVTVFPVLVQGDKAPQDITNMINLIDREYNDIIDLIIVGRGGGAIEDLAAFNDEGLARAIYNCSIPIISAVGHEIDTTISDFVADVRAETPTAAAQIAVRSSEELRELLNSKMWEMNKELSNMLGQKMFRIEGIFNQIDGRMRELIYKGEAEAEKAFLLLKENDPRKFLDKGYALVTDSKGKHIKSSKKIKAGSEYQLIFNDGSAKVRGE